MKNWILIFFGLIGAMNTIGAERSPFGAGRWIDLEALKPIVAAHHGSRLGRDFVLAETAVDNPTIV